MDSGLAKSYESICISRERLRAEIGDLVTALRLLEPPAENRRGKDGYQTKSWARQLAMVRSEHG